MNPRYLQILLGGGLAVASTHAADPFPAEQIEFFEKRVRPVLAENCYDCHGDHKHENGLRVDLRSALLRGSDYGKVVEAGNPAASKLIKAIQHAPGVEAMPKKGGKLKPEEIAALEEWVRMGLPWPEEKAVAHGPARDPMQHWAFQPVKKPQPPADNPAANPVDAFIGANLKAAGLDFAPPAEPAALCRRLFVTLTGLQPTFEDVRAFEQAAAKDLQGAVRDLTERLLNSPAYGERWARHWLDVVRYADTDGYQVAGKSNRYPYAYTYRDWVVDSLNRDLPYDQFLIHQLAADKLHPGDPAHPSLAALAFLNIGDRFISNKDLQTDDRIDVVTRGMIGLTVGCARCHDHKYDPIPSKDYYALYSVFNSSVEPAAEALPIIGRAPNEADAKAYQARVDEIAGKELNFKKKVHAEIRDPARLVDYLAFVREAEGIKDTTARRGRAGQLKLRDKVADKWGEFVKRHALADKPHPVMLAWKEFAALPEAEFAAKAPAVVAKLVKPETGLGGVPRNELAKRPAPKNFGEVAALYADIFNTCLAGSEPDNADWQQVRAILDSEPSPMALPVERMNEFFTRRDQTETVKLANERIKLETDHPGAPPRAMVMVDRDKPADVRIFIRGNPSRQGDVSPRGWLTMFGGDKFTEGSGRLELARKIASKDNPLTARVIVNRVWAQHFGKPLVGTPSDFGVQTDAPTQQAVLDHLAATFMDEGWSLKNLHRNLVTSRAWQQASSVSPEKALKDADNELISRQNRQRLDYEAMRDAMLQVAGELDTGRVGGRAIALNDKVADSRRSLYLLVDRYDQATVPAMFDFANPDSHSPMRYNTAVPQQALFLMNSPFLRQRSQTLANATPVEGSTVDSKSIEALYRRVLHRAPSTAEAELAQRFCSDADALGGRRFAFIWTYGSGRVEKDAAGKASLADFAPLAHFSQEGKTLRWTPAKTYPDKEQGHLYVGPGGGHPGGAAAAVLQWIAPADEMLRVGGTIKRPSERGNGVRAWILSNRTGAVKEALVPPTGSAEMNAELRVQKGEVLSFVVECVDGSTDSDSYSWVPRLERVDPSTGQAVLLTKADSDFCGPAGWPLNREKPQSPLAQLAQVLLMSNEFQFVD